MNCVVCKKDYDFTKATRIYCKCCYCTKCIATKIYDTKKFDTNVIIGLIDCCNKTDRIAYGVDSLIDIEIKKNEKQK